MRCGAERYVNATDTKSIVRANAFVILPNAKERINGINIGTLHVGAQQCLISGLATFAFNLSVIAL